MLPKDCQVLIENVHPINLLEREYVWHELLNFQCHLACAFLKV